MNILLADYTGWLWAKLDFGPQSYQTTVSGTDESESEPDFDTLPIKNTCAEVILINGSAGTAADNEQSQNGKTACSDDAALICDCRSESGFTCQVRGTANLT